MQLCRDTILCGRPTLAMRQQARVVSLPLPAPPLPAPSSPPPPSALPALLSDICQRCCRHFHTAAHGLANDDVQANFVVHARSVGSFGSSPPRAPMRGANRSARSLLSWLHVFTFVMADVRWPVVFHISARHRTRGVGATTTGVWVEKCLRATVHAGVASHALVRGGVGITT